ncbi:MAG TPA: lipid A-modifier LpxR family protein, partial [Acetobacteraceae bacterium]|nr:lipid A-modifier LpxR family protein [Acetobacteraceae bacterium]
MRLWRTSLLGALLSAGLALPALAQQADTSVRPFSGGIWSVRVENDKFTTLPLGSDKYYTSGLEATWVSDPGQAVISRFTKVASGPRVSTFGSTASPQR